MAGFSAMLTVFVIVMLVGLVLIGYIIGYTRGLAQ